ncbi:MAG: hypothetical protein WCK63_10200 [Betaproteobacteria bacterium]
MSTISSITLALLQNIFPNVILIDSHKAASSLGIAYKTLNNAGADFPIKPVKFGRNKFYRLIDIAAFIDNSLGIAVSPAATQIAPPSDLTQQKRGRGRPRKQQLKENTRQRVGVSL